MAGGLIITRCHNQQGRGLKCPRAVLAVLFIHEAGHRHFEVPVVVHPSLNHDITVVLEYIQAVVLVEKLQNAVDVQLASNAISEQYGRSWGILCQITLHRRSQEYGTFLPGSTLAVVCHWHHRFRELFAMKCPRITS